MPFRLRRRKSLCPLSSGHLGKARCAHLFLPTLTVQRIPHIVCFTVHVPKRENAIVNRLNKTKVERVVDHEAEKVERVRHENAAKRAAAAAKVRSTLLRQEECIAQYNSPTLQKKADLELAEARKAEKAARSYDSFLNAEVDEEEEAAEPKYNSVREMEEDFM
jgi:hypothetical protein